MLDGESRGEYFKTEHYKKQQIQRSLKEKEKEVEDKVLFDLMFHGCQQINTTQARVLLDKIKEGKIRGVTFNLDEV